MLISYKIVFLRPNMLPLICQHVVALLHSSKLTKPYRGNSAKEAAKRISTDSDSLIIGSLRWGRAGRRTLHIDLRKVPEERRKRQKAAQHTLELLAVSRLALENRLYLVVTEQCKVETSDDRDGDVELCAREAVELLHLGRRLFAARSINSLRQLFRGTYAQ